jgi:hypothetical protein
VSADRVAIRGSTEQPGDLLGLGALVGLALAREAHVSVTI